MAYMYTQIYGIYKVKIYGTLVNCDSLVALSCFAVTVSSSKWHTGMSKTLAFKATCWRTELSLSWLQGLGQACADEEI